ncbi:MAG: protein translocase subunit SecD [Candidatus Blackburnbacteria bacterium]|nr:protein translocase subunit SecD [Candidatus Blackburnbacteria bacterium]
MGSSVRRVFIIVILILVAAFVALPDELPINFGYGNFKVNYVLQRPPVSLNYGSFSFQRDLDLKLGLDLAGGSHLVFEADVTGIDASDQDLAVESARSAIDRRINLFGVSESTVQTAKVGTSRRIIVELPGIKDAQQAVSLIGKTARLDFRELTDTVEATQGAVFLTLDNTKTTGFTGADFERAKPDFDSTTGKPVVSFEMKQDSAKKFGEITTRLQGKRLAIFLDETPISAPVIQTPITEGRGQITGEFTLQEVKDLSNLLSAGALPVPVKPIEQRTVEASLGRESIQKSVVAGVVGLGMVVLFMVLNYRVLGFLASVALLIYGILTLALYKLIPIVLTLPGIAGFILSVGMAVDSNILIFERMKEELMSGRSWQNSMESAFGRAWDSIRDANIATLLTAFVLFNPLNFSFLHTSGPVRGFALTLALGIAVSLFTGVFVTRTLMRVFAKKDIQKKI